MFRTRTPLSLSRKTNTARLACVRPPASVHPEPGSNSPLYVCFPLTQSLIDALVFPYLVVILYFNDLFSFAFLRQIFLSVVCLNCVCKSINFISILQIFLKLFLRLFYCSRFSCATDYYSVFQWGKSTNFL